MSNVFEQNNEQSNQIRSSSSKADAKTFQQSSNEMVNFLRGEKYVHPYRFIMMIKHKNPELLREQPYGSFYPSKSWTAINLRRKPFLTRVIRRILKQLLAKLNLQSFRSS